MLRGFLVVRVLSVFVPMSMVTMTVVVAVMVVMRVRMTAMAVVIVMSVVAAVVMFTMLMVVVGSAVVVVVMAVMVVVPMMRVVVAVMRVVVVGMMVMVTVMRVVVVGMRVVWIVVGMVRFCVFLDLHSYAEELVNLLGGCLSVQVNSLCPLQLRVDADVVPFVIFVLDRVAFVAWLQLGKHLRHFLEGSGLGKRKSSNYSV